MVGLPVASYETAMYRAWILIGASRLALAVNEVEAESNGAAMESTIAVPMAVEV